MTYTRHLSYSRMKRGREYETFLIFCSAQDSSPTDHTSFLPESPRPVVDRSVDYTPVPVWSAMGFGIPVVFSPDSPNDLRELRWGHEDTPPSHDWDRSVPVLVFLQQPCPTGTAKRRFFKTSRA